MKEQIIWEKIEKSERKKKGKRKTSSLKSGFKSAPRVIYIPTLKRKQRII